MKSVRETIGSMSWPQVVYKTSLLAMMLAAFAIYSLGQETAKDGCLCGIVVDSNGARIPGAEVSNVYLGVKIVTNEMGEFNITRGSHGKVTVSISANGFESATREISAGGENTVTLVQKAVSEMVMISSATLAGTAEALETTAGSFQKISREELENARVFDFGEVLRKVPGIHVRDEEGFGLRPNISLRGTNPTRSSKLLLLEDGMPLSYAPYGDNASYYHPPVERFEAIEVLKGSGQIEYGPVTVAGVINYLTPNPTERFSGSLRLTGGGRDYFNGNALLSGTFKGTGMVLNVNRKQGEGARENTRSGLSDVSAKFVRQFGSNQIVSFKTTVLDEGSQVTYSGLTLAEFRSNPRGNVFANDRFDGRRVGFAGTYSVVAGPNASVNVGAYLNSFSRDWWRQSSNSAQRPNRLGVDSDCRSMADLFTTCGNEGRLRDYVNAGVSPHATFTYSLNGLRGETKVGFRYHYEKQNRLQKNGDFPQSRDGIVAENNRRENRAVSGFVQSRLIRGDFAVTAGLRIEKIGYARLNRLNGASGETDLTQLIPGLGVTYNIGSKLTAFAGVHRGFAPPRVEDIVTNAGGVVDIDSELSWNYEAGIRSRPLTSLSLEGTFFRNAFSNQIVAASVAGGTGATFTNGGRTLQQGLEFSGRFDSAGMLPIEGNLFVQFGYTGLMDSEFRGRRFSALSGFGNVSVSGNRLPYTSRHTVNAMLGYSRGSWELFVENNSMTDQFTDDINSVNPSADGQRGKIAGQTYWNATFNYKVERIKTAFFLTAKNILDRTFIVDRSRGMLPSSPRLLQAGLNFRF